MKKACSLTVLILLVAMTGICAGYTVPVAPKGDGNLPYVSKSGEPITFDEFLRDRSCTRQYIE